MFSSSCILDGLGKPILGCRIGGFLGFGFLLNCPLLLWLGRLRVLACVSWGLYFVDLLDGVVVFAVGGFAYYTCRFADLLICVVGYGGGIVRFRWAC